MGVDTIGHEIHAEPELVDEAVSKRQFSEMRAKLQKAKSQQHVLKEAIRSKNFNSIVDEDQFKWRVNTSVAIVINANYLSEALLDEYLTNIFTKLGADRVRHDLVVFIEDTLAPYLDRTADAIWASQFQSTVSPGIPKLVKAFPALTKLYNFQKQQFTLQPMDLKYFVTEEKVQLTAMSALMESMTGRIEMLEKKPPAPSIAMNEQK